MPVTRSRTYLADIGLEDSNNTTGFLFGDEDSNPAETRTTPTAQVGNTDTFPSLYRQQAYPSMVSLPAFLGLCVCSPGSVWLPFCPFLSLSLLRCLCFGFCHFCNFRTWVLHRISVFRRLVPARKHAPPHARPALNFHSDISRLHCSPSLELDHQPSRLAFFLTAFLYPICHRVCFSSATQITIVTASFFHCKIFLPAVPRAAIPFCIRLAG